MRTEEELQRAIQAIHVRFGDQALVRATRLPAVEPWATGLAAVDRLSGIGGLPRGRISLLRGDAGSGKLSLGLALLARATRAFARVVVLDPGRGFDPWTLEPLGAGFDNLTVVRPPTPAAAGEAAVALARAGAGFLLALEEPPEPALAPLESAAARSGCAVLAVSEASSKPLAFASSFTLELARECWLWERRELVGLRARVDCVKNKLAAPAGRAQLEVRYALGPRQAWPEPVREVAALEEAEAARSGLAG